MKLAPVSEQRLLDMFHSGGSSALHLLTIYSMVVGLRAKAVMDLGVGATTKVLRCAAERTGGTVYSCDRSVEHYGDLQSEQTDTWKLFIGDSQLFLDSLSDDIAFDFVMHDAAHDYTRVKKDLDRIIPKMKKFGLICVHDAQHLKLGEGIYRAINEAIAGKAITATCLPYGCGMAVIRVEDSAHPSVDVASVKNEGDTRPFNTCQPLALAS